MDVQALPIPTQLAAHVQRGILGCSEARSLNGFTGRTLDAEALCFLGWSLQHSGPPWSPNSTFAGTKDASFRSSFHAHLRLLLPPVQAFWVLGGT